MNIFDVQTITVEEQQWLTRRLEEEEVLEGIKMCAAGPDGYTMIYFQTLWETRKEDLMLTFHNFHTHQKFEKKFKSYICSFDSKEGGGK